MSVTSQGSSLNTGGGISDRLTDETAAVRVWLFGVAALVLAMTVVGGATRLTDSGLSITEWQPLLGAIPPLSDAAWAEAFQKYQQIPQFKILNHAMVLDEFKFIYWWEWAHRFLGRFIGLAYAVPLAWFALRRRIPAGFMPRLLVILLLGGMQGAVGWWMVASGLEARTSVAPYRLATHLTLACVIFAALVWTALSLKPRQATPIRTASLPVSIHVMAGVLLAAVFLQIFLGALVAGNDAGLVYNTWPDMNGAFLPAEALSLKPFWRNFFEDHATVQFVHRLGAYLLLAVSFWQAVAARRLSGADRARVSAFVVFGLTIAQAMVGIATLLLVVPLSIALIHQALAVILLGAVNYHTHEVFAQPMARQMSK